MIDSTTPLKPPSNEETATQVQDICHTVEDISKHLRHYLPPTPTLQQSGKFINCLADNGLLHISAACNNGVLLFTIMPVLDTEGKDVGIFAEIDTGLVLTKLIGVLMLSVGYNVETGKFDLFQEEEANGKCTAESCRGCTVQSTDDTERRSTLSQEDIGEGTNNTKQ